MSALPSKINNDLNIEEIGWATIREAVFSINPSLAEAIEDIYPDKKYNFYRARYPYGARIINKGHFKIFPSSELLLI